MNGEIPTGGDMSPEAAAQFAVSGPESHAAAEGFESTSKPTWYRALRSSSPHKPIHEYEGIADTVAEWDRYGVRSLEKMAGMDDTEAWVDGLRFAIGAALWAVGIGSGPSLSRERGETDDEPPMPTTDELEVSGDVGGEVPR